MVGIRSKNPAPAGLPKAGDDLKTAGIKGRAARVPVSVRVPKTRERLDINEETVRPLPVNQGMAVPTRVPGALMPGVPLVRVPTRVATAAGHQVQAAGPPFHAAPRRHAVRPLAEKAPVPLRIGVRRLARRGAAGGVGVAASPARTRPRTAADGIGVAVGTGRRAPETHRHGAIPATQGGAPVDMGRPQTAPYGRPPGFAHADAPVAGRVTDAARDVAPHGPVAPAFRALDELARSPPRRATARTEVASAGRADQADGMAGR